MKGSKRKKEQGTASRAVAGVSLAALVAAVAVFVILTQMEKSMLADYEKGTVYMAAAAIPRGQRITEENFAEYFSKGELDVKYIPRTALTVLEQIQDLAAVYDVEPGVVLTEGMFEKVSDVLGHMAEPVIAGFKADDVYQVAGGILRAGDRIHIYSVREGEEVISWEEVYIQQVFDASGETIPNGDRTTAAQRVNVYLDKSDVELFYQGLAQGSLRVVKICTQEVGD